MEMSFSKKHEASYVFSDTISRISKILNDKKVIESLNSQTQLPYLFTDRSSPISFNYSLIDFTSMEHKKKLTWLLSSKSIATNINYTFNLLSNTIDNTTLLVFEIVILNPENIPQDKHKKLMCGSKEICVEMINGIDKALQMNYDNIYQFESIVVKASREKLWEHFINLNFLRKRGIDDIRFVGSRDKVGTEVSWNDKKDNLKCSFRVIKASNNESQKKWKFKIKALEGHFQSQDIEFTMIKLSEKETFLSISHTFNEKISVEIIKEVEEKKKNNLNLLKQSMETELSNGNESIEKEMNGNGNTLDH